MKKLFVHQSLIIMTIVLLAAVAGAEEVRVYQFENRDGQTKAIDGAVVPMDDHHTAGFKLSPREFAISSEFAGFDLSLLFSAEGDKTILELQEDGELTENMGRLAFPIAATLLEREGKLSPHKPGKPGKPAGNVSVVGGEILTITQSEDLGISMLLTPNTDAGLSMSPPVGLGDLKIESCSGACNCSLCVCQGSGSCCSAGCSGCFEVIGELKEAEAN